eukprot:2366-Heterococcus_DN1.PRE.3
MDTKFTMTAGTFEALNCNPRVLASCSNCVIKWEFDVGADLDVWCVGFCGDGSSTLEVTYQVVAERHDKHIMESEMTDAEGHLIPEYERPARYRSEGTCVTDSVRRYTCRTAACRVSTALQACLSYNCARCQAATPGPVIFCCRVSEYQILTCARFLHMKPPEHAWTIAATAV